MFLHIGRVIMVAFFLVGGLYMTSRRGGSVASASAAKVSMIRLTQSIYTAVRGESLKMTEPMKTMHKATTLTVS